MRLAPRAALSPCGADPGLYRSSITPEGALELLYLRMRQPGGAPRQLSDSRKNCAVTWVRLYSRRGCTLRITEIRSAGLRHGTPEGGWSNEIRPEDCVHTLIAVFTDEGVTGWGSAFTNDELVRGALGVLEPLYRGENPLEPERVSEKLHAQHLLDGPRRLDHARDQRHRYRAVGHSRQGDRPARRAAARRTLSRARAALRFAADARTARAGRTTERHSRAGISRFQDRLGTLRPAQLRDGRSHRARGARGGRAGLAPDGGRGRERRLLAAGLQVGGADRADARRLRRPLVRGAASARQSARLRAAAQHVARYPSRAARS